MKILVSVVVLVCVATSTRGVADDGAGVPDGLSANDWSSIRGAYEAKKHEAFESEGGWQVRNPGQRWRTRFDGRGFVVMPDGSDGHAAPWSWGLELTGLGRGGETRSVEGAAASVEANGGRIEYRWDETLTEWYINDARGLEHGYTITQPPAADGTNCDVAPLHVAMSVRGGLCPRVSGDGRGVTFVNDAGVMVVNYTGLTVLDAHGASLPAWFAEAGGGLVLSVDDRGALYPLTIDPIAQQAYLKASNTQMDDRFGTAVAVSGDTVVVGAEDERSNATGVNGNQADNSLGAAGAAYIFVRSGGTWTQQAYLKASNTGSGDRFGRAVAIDGDTVVIGAYQEASSATGVNGDQLDNGANLSGAVYIFVRSAGVWTQQAYLKASNTAAIDFFGYSVGVSGDTVVAGALSEDSNATGVNGDASNNSATDSGAAYVFVRSGSSWSQQAYLKASNTGAGDAFGTSAAISGDTVVVGAFGEDSNATGVNGNQANNSSGLAGAVYVFVRGVGGSWSQQAYLKPSNTGAGDYFGNSVFVSGDSVVAGAPNESSSATGVNGNGADNSAPRSGAAYVFARSGGVWNQQAYLKASNTAAEDGFGRAVTVGEDTVVVGAEDEDSAAPGVNGDQSNNGMLTAGAAYVFRRAGGSWDQLAYLKASNPGLVDRFGCAVAVNGDTVVVGAYGESSNATGVDGNQNNNSALRSGAVYVFAVTGSCPPCAADFNADGGIDGTDIEAFFAAWESGESCGDVNEDGGIDGSDVDAFFVDWEAGVC